MAGPTRWHGLCSKTPRSPLLRGRDVRANMRVLAAIVAVLFIAQLGVVLALDHGHAGAAGPGAALVPAGADAQFDADAEAQAAGAGGRKLLSAVVNCKW